MGVINAKFLLRRGLKAEWESINPVLDRGEPGFAVDANILKVGDGIHQWTDLAEIDQHALDQITDLMVDIDELRYQLMWSDFN